MLGEVVYTPDNFIAEQVTTLRPVLDSVKNLDKIFIPPMPWFAFGGCCEALRTHQTHVARTKHTSHSFFALTEHVRQCNSITKHINDTKTKNFKVIDLLGTLTPSTS